jgi:hypothetical protein
VEAAPLTTSILLIIELGIPDKPYTVLRALTMGMPSIVTIVWTVQTIDPDVASVTNIAIVLWTQAIYIV